MTLNRLYVEVLEIKKMLAADNLVTPEQMARELGVTEKTLLNWKAKKKLEGCYTRNRGGQVMYDRAKMKDIRN